MFLPMPHHTYALDPLKELNDLHRMEAKLRWCLNFIKPVKNSALTKEERLTIDQIEAALSHKEARRRFIVLSLSWRRVIVEGEASDPQKLSESLIKYFEQLPSTSKPPLYKKSLEDQDYALFSVHKSSLVRQCSSGKVNGSKSKMDVEVLIRMTEDWVERVGGQVSLFQSFLKNYQEPPQALPEVQASLPSPSISPERPSTSKATAQVAPAILAPDSDEMDFEKTDPLAEYINDAGEERGDRSTQEPSTEEPSTQEESHSGPSSSAIVPQVSVHLNEGQLPLQSTHPGSLGSPSIPHPASSPRIRLQDQPSSSRSFASTSQVPAKREGSRNQPKSLPPVLRYIPPDDVSLEGKLWSEARLSKPEINKIQAASRAEKVKLAADRRAATMNSSVEESQEVSFSDLRIPFPKQTFAGVVIPASPNQRRNRKSASPFPVNAENKSSSPTTVPSIAAPVRPLVTSSHTQQVEEPTSSSSKSSSSSSFPLPPGAQVQAATSPNSFLLEGDSTIASSGLLPSLSISTVDGGPFELFTQAISMDHLGNESESQSQSLERSQSQDVDSGLSYVSDDTAERMAIEARKKKAEMEVMVAEAKKVEDVEAEGKKVSDEMEGVIEATQDEIVIEEAGQNDSMNFNDCGDHASSGLEDDDDEVERLVALIGTDV